MDITALRDHADQMLTVIATDLGTAQSESQQSEKSMGRGPDSGTGTHTPAEQHGTGRAHSGFTVEQMVAEYRALRASVIRLWTASVGELKAADIEDLTRFNEAIDQSLAESVTHFNHNIEQAKETFLAILGHDLRLPLGAIRTSATFMLDTGGQVEPHRTLITRIVGSATRSMSMVGDLLDFTRSRLGAGIPVVRTEMSMSQVVRDLVNEISTTHPDRVINVQAHGTERGWWDEARLSQALGNLIGNAVEHGSEETPVTVTIQGATEHVVVTVHNSGAVMPSTQLDGIFNPMKPRMTPRKASPHGPSGSLGLGLYIAERIVNAHGGRIDVESSEGAGTTFTVYLSRGAQTTVA
jgi:signal transduction histidine kinase